MFADETLEPVEFKSFVGKDKYVIDNVTQTKVISFIERGMQACKRREKSVQTDDNNERNLEFGDVSVNNEKLLRFLKRWESYFDHLFTQNVQSKAFLGYDVRWTDSDVETITKSFNLKYEKMFGQLGVTGISWSCTGSVIAVAYGNCDHENWCTHRAAVCTWNLDLSKLNEVKPDNIIDTESCVTSLAFHPKKSGILAVGTFDGSVLVCDLTQPNDLVSSMSTMNDDGHREPVTCISWVAVAGDKYSLFSCSSDGKMLLWKQNSRRNKSAENNNLRLTDGYILLAGNLPRARNIGRRDKEMGITALTLHPDLKDVFLCGSESGGIFKCGFDVRGMLASRHVVTSTPLHSPVTFSYSPQSGPVYSLEYFANHRNIFASVSSDGAISFYSILQVEPLYSIDTGLVLYSGSCSPSHPCVFAVGTDDGNVLLFDLAFSFSIPRHTLKSNEYRKSVYVTSFCSQRPHLLAAGDATGSVTIWRLPEALVKGEASTHVLDSLILE